MNKSISFDHTLLWEYDLETFNYDKSYFIVIERVIQRGDVGDWKKIINYYGKSKILETAEKSKQLNIRDKNFAKLFINSDFINV